MSKSFKGFKVSGIHGLNPSIDVCIICGEIRKVAISGELKNDARAPDYIMTSIEPCKECREKHLKKGVLIVEDPEKTEIPSIAIVDESFIDKHFPGTDYSKRIVIMEYDLFNFFFKDEIPEDVEKS